MNNKSNIMLNIYRQNYQLHPFHLVENSPWPFFSSFSLFGLAMNTALTSHGYIQSSRFTFMRWIVFTLVFELF